MDVALSKFVARRLAMMVPVLLGVSLVTFLLVHVVPGDPAAMLLGQKANPQAVAELRARMGLNKPLCEQYLLYLGQLLRGDLGISLHTSQPVTQDLINRFPATAELALTSLLIAVVVGVPFGVISATRPNSMWDHAARLGALFGVSVPSFWLGLVLIYVFFYLLGWVPPPTGRLDIMLAAPPKVTGFLVVDAVVAGDREVLKNAVWHLILPAITLSAGTLAITTRMVRSSMMEALRTDYIRTAKAKGLPEWLVTVKHALRNALIPTITVLGLEVGYLLGGSVLVETIFAWPGMGQYSVESASWLDYAPIQGFALFAAVMYSVVNFLVDVTYSIIDPRVRY